MVPGVSHRHVSVVGEGQALRAVEGVCRGVDVGQEGTGAVKHLQYSKQESWQDLFIQNVLEDLAGQNVEGQK